MPARCGGARTGPARGSAAVRKGRGVGLGLGDVSDEVRAIKTFLRRKFSYARDLDDSRVYDGHLVTVVADMQARYAAQGKIGAHVPGVINVETKYAMGYLPRQPKPKPVIFTVSPPLTMSPS